MGLAHTLNSLLSEWATSSEWFRTYLLLAHKFTTKNHGSSQKSNPLSCFSEVASQKLNFLASIFGSATIGHEKFIIDVKNQEKKSFGLSRASNEIWDEIAVAEGETKSERNKVVQGGIRRERSTLDKVRPIDSGKFG